MMARRSPPSASPSAGAIEASTSVPDDRLWVLGFRCWGNGVGASSPDTHNPTPITHNPSPSLKAWDCGLGHDLAIVVGEAHQRARLGSSHQRQAGASKVDLVVSVGAVASV